MTMTSASQTPNLDPAPTEPSAAVHGRILQLDGLRAVAILAVFLNHSLHTPLTWAGVDIFFVLSGFLITGILLQRKGSGGGYFSYFYKRRAFRILPAYALTLFIYGLFFTWWTFQPWWLFAFFGMNFQRLVYHGHIFYPLPLWSLAVEEQFYFVWPFVILLVSEKTLFRLAVGALIFTPLLRFVCTPLFASEFTIYMLTPFRADLLCAGAALAILWKNRSPAFEALCRTRAWIGVIMGFGLLALSQHWPVMRLAANSRPGNTFVYSLSLIGSISLLAWTLADRGWLRSFLSTRPMRFIGQISYTLYLVHLIPIFLLEGHTTSRPVIALISLPIILVYATLSWFLMEKPLIAFAARKPARENTRKHA
jgi:peptidoglycan/LPS O-acetylase OafA/YrhL